MYTIISLGGFGFCLTSFVVFQKKHIILGNALSVVGNVCWGVIGWNGGNINWAMIGQSLCFFGISVVALSVIARSKKVA